MKYPSLALAAVALIAAAPTPPPPPPTLPPATPPPSASAAAPTPAASATPNALDTLFGPGGPQGAPGAKAPKPANRMATPPPDARQGLDGVWEIQIQRGANTDYEHFKLKQVGTTLTGIYLTKSNKKYPVAGSLDGTNIRLIVSLNDGSTMLFEGRIDGTTDMLGMLTDSKERVPFTAAYRPKEKWFDNVNPNPGLGSGGPR